MFPNWLQTALPREVLNEKFLTIGFSQSGEDDTIRGYFWEEILSGYRGTYIDIGCYSETLYSNTKLLSLIGWHGIAIDANPELEVPWLNSRPNDFFLNYCVAPQDGNEDGMRFFRFKDGAMSTASLTRAKKLISEGWELSDIVNIPRISLLGIAKEAYSHGITNPDIVSIDLEMIDYLEDLPKFLGTLKPRLLCMEMLSNYNTLDEVVCSREVKKLKASDYEAIGLIGGNIFAKPRSIENELGILSR